jgi:hypothetical protein
MKYVYCETGLNFKYGFKGPKDNIQLYVGHGNTSVWGVRVRRCTVN